MRPIPPPHGNDPPSAASRQGRAGWERPTLGGTARATVMALVLVATSVLVVVPAVFSFVPIPPDADGLTLCIPGIGPLQRFNEGLEGDREELVHIHERVHAEQCRSWGAMWFVGRLATPRGRLAVEAQALCAEVEVLALRGADRERMIGWMVDALASEYFPDGEPGRGEIATVVAAECGRSLLAE